MAATLEALAFLPACRATSPAILAQLALAGHDVLLPQYLGRLEFVTQRDALAAQVGVPFVEVALVSDADDAVARFVRRSLNPQTPEQSDALALQERFGGTSELEQMYQRLLEVIAARPGTRTVPTLEGQVEQTFQLLRAAIGQYQLGD